MNTLTKVKNLDLLDPFGYPVYEEGNTIKGQQPAPAPKPGEGSTPKKQDLNPGSL